jgi:thioesterase domain-containing protein
LVLIHATPGDVLGYGNLVAELPDDLPCWGIVSRALHEPQRPHQSIPEMAADYLEALHTRLGDSPFALGGWCYGGLVAYEMACLLARTGRPPPLRLLLIETWCPRPSAPIRAFRLRWQQALTLLRLPPPRLLAYLRHKLDARRTTAPSSAPSTPRRTATLARNLAAAQRYRAGPYRLPVDLFFAPDMAPDILPLPEGGWSVLAEQRTVHFCGGGHADLLHPPHARQLAAQMAALLTGGEALKRPGLCAASTLHSSARKAGPLLQA